jgi:hypothetical protein
VCVCGELPKNTRNQLLSGLSRDYFQKLIPTTTIGIKYSTLLMLLLFGSFMFAQQQSSDVTLFWQFHIFSS